MIALTVIAWLMFFVACVGCAGSPMRGMWPVLIPASWLFVILWEGMKREAPGLLTTDKMARLMEMCGDSPDCWINGLTFWRWERREIGLFNWKEHQLLDARRHPLGYIGKRCGVMCYLPSYIPEESSCNASGERGTLDPREQKP